jgi:GNAT superfamily N-acetyltransferase
VDVPNGIISRLPTADALNFPDSAMADDLFIRPAEREDTGRILDLVKLCMGEGKIPYHVDYWRWKHQDNLFGPSACLLGEVGGRLVGLRVFMRWTWLAGGVMVPAVRAVDTATHPEWRGRGVFSRLNRSLVKQMKAEGIAFIFNTPNDQSLPANLKMGWVSVGRVSLWVRALRSLRLIHSLLFSRRLGSAVADSDVNEDVGEPMLNVMEQAVFPRFLETLPLSADRFSTPRNSDYLRWRYVEIPGLEYRAVWHLDGKDGAVVIFRIKSEHGLRELRLCEVLVGTSVKSGRMGRDLLRSVVRETEAHFASAMAVTGTPEQRVLLRTGFFPAPRVGPVMTVRLLNGVKNGLNPLHRTDWRLSIGDLELF